MPTYFIGLNILLTRQGGDFDYYQNNTFILFLYPGRFGRMSVSRNKGWQFRLRRVDWNSSAKLLIAVERMQGKIMKFGKKNCVYILSR
jgi:hypothetical protein